MRGPRPLLAVFEAMDRLAQRPGERIGRARPIERAQPSGSARSTERGVKNSSGEGSSAALAERRDQRHELGETGDAEPGTARAAAAATGREEEIEKDATPARQRPL